MRWTAPVLLATALLCGCTSVVRPSDLRPASHPLLESLAPRTRMLPIAETRRRRVRDVESRRAEEARIAAAERAVDGVEDAPEGAAGGAGGEARGAEAGAAKSGATKASATKSGAAKSSAAKSSAAKSGAAKSNATQSNTAPAAPVQSSAAPAAAAAPAPAKTEPSPRPARRAGATTPERATPDTRAPDDGRARAARRAVLAALTPLIGQRSLGDATPTDLGLLRAAFADVKGAPADADTIAALRRQSRLVRGAPRPGDLLFFHGAGGAAELAIVRSVGGDGVIDAVAVTRGAVRSVVVDRNNPHARRRGGRVVNTFLRARRQDDEPRAAYLAAQLLVDVRSIID